MRFVNCWKEGIGICSKCFLFFLLLPSQHRWYRQQEEKETSWTNNNTWDHPMWKLACCNLSWKYWMILENTYPHPSLLPRLCLLLPEAQGEGDGGVAVNWVWKTFPTPYIITTWVLLRKIYIKSKWSLKNTDDVS